ncbi:MAG: permease [Hoeflea sp.]|nr:permease [Hoeflea sp.]
MTSLSIRNDHSRMSALIALVALTWGVAVAVSSSTGLLARIPMPLIALLVGLGIALPTLWYFVSESLRAWTEAVGLRAITAFHIWRIPAAMLFFFYGIRGELPAVFWIVAGTGDLIAGCYAAWVVTRKTPSADQYLRMHRFGFADFVVAVGTGLTFTLLLNPKMALIATLPFALIPLYGVGISGASHIIAFDMLRRKGARDN